MLAGESKNFERASVGDDEAVLRTRVVDDDGAGAGASGSVGGCGRGGAAAGGLGWGATGAAA